MAEIVILPDADAAGSLVAREIAALIARTPDAVLGLATGSTPLPVYRALARLVADLDVSRVRGFALDEYVGLEPGHPESYRAVITREVVEPRRHAAEIADPVAVAVGEGAEIELIDDTAAPPVGVGEGRFCHRVRVLP